MVQKSGSDGIANQCIPEVDSGRRGSEVLEEGEGMGRRADSNVSGNEIGGEMGNEALDKCLLVDKVYLRN